MYSLLINPEPKLVPVFYDRLCEDVIGHVISFLGDEEKAEWCHVNSKLRQFICEYSPQTKIPLCRVCQRYIKRCSCQKKKECCNRVVSVVVLWLFLVLFASFVVAILGYQRGWF